MGAIGSLDWLARPSFLARQLFAKCLFEPAAMDEENRGPRILITVWTLTGLSGVFLTVRLACKLWAKRRLWWDDYVLALSWVGIHSLQRLLYQVVSDC